MVRINFEETINNWRAKKKMIVGEKAITFFDSIQFGISTVRFHVYENKKTTIHYLEAKEKKYRSLFSSRNHQKKPSPPLFSLNYGTFRFSSRIMARIMQSHRRMPGQPVDVDDKDDEVKSVGSQIKELFALLRKAKPNDANGKNAIEVINNVVVQLVNVDGPRDSKGKSLLLTAIESKNYAIAQLLLEKGAGKDMDDQLLLAAKVCSVEAFTYMLDE